MKVLNNAIYEKELIGCLLQDTDLIGKLRITEKQLDFKKHKKILKAILELYNEGRKIDGVTLGDKIKSSLSEYYDFHDTCGTTQQFESLENAIIDLYEKRLFRKKINQAQKGLNDGWKLEDIKGLFEDMRLDIDRNEDKGIPMNGVVNDTLETIQDAVNVNGKITGMESGFNNLDNVLNGFEKGKYFIVGARPGVGKTAFALEITRRLSLKNKVAFFSVEMTKTELGQRLLASESLIPMNNLKKGKLKADTFVKILDYANKLETRNLIVNDDESMTIEKLVRLSKFYKVEYGIDAIVVDYITLLDTVYRFNREVDKVTYISAQLRKLAKSLDIAVICLTQLNRNVEGRGSNEPMLSDIKESGSIEQDANVVILLYNPPREEMDEELEKFNKQTLFVKIAKNRGGELLSKPIIMDYYKRTQRIEERPNKK
ncbi:MAG: replicative DNA helicase [Clostridium sp.]